METLRFVDLFAGIGGFRLALQSLGHECVFASEIDHELRELYALNFPAATQIIHGDIRKSKSDVPHHDVLCAGFPCQPFSKSGRQEGTNDPTDGTLFHEVIEIARNRSPSYVILENVGNFERHDHGNTWNTVEESLTRIGYHVRGTSHVASGGHGLISPHHFGHPQTRERFFAVASREPLPHDPFPKGDRGRVTDLASIVQLTGDLTPEDKVETSLSRQSMACIEHWNRLLKAIPAESEVLSPIWGDEIWERYPFRESTPWTLSKEDLASVVGRRRAKRSASKAALLRSLPSYARSKRKHFPDWKIDFIAENRRWLHQIRPRLPPGWTWRLKRFPASHRKLEWNCKGEDRDLWNCVLQFRPSGLRAKRYTSSPALVAMTATQIPILGPERRFLTRTEGRRLQGFPDDHLLPKSYDDAFAALGNAVHVGVARVVAERLLRGGIGDASAIAQLGSESTASSASRLVPRISRAEFAGIMARLRGEVK